ncbi:MAG: DUF1579 domain-containing protein [bacterium]|nr:DUF1579 domain-containing protein [bacterium]
MNTMKNTTRVLLVALFVVILATVSCERGSAEQVKALGYRPGSDGAGQFLESIGAATITVLPTAVWSTEETIFLPASQEQIVQLIEENRLGVANTADFEAYKSVVEDQSQGQWGVFESGLKQVKKRALDTKSAGDYFLFLELMEFRPRSGEIAVGGIQCYVVGRNGEDAFSFLFNSHHAAFNDAQLITQDTSEEGRARLVSACTDLALRALVDQIEDARAAATAEREEASEDASRLQALDNYVGEWDWVTTSEDSPPTNGHTSAEWILGNRFVRETVSLPNEDGMTSREIHILRTYDEGTNTFRAWNFDSDFPVSQSTGTWNAETRTLTSVAGGGGDGIAVTTKSNFAKEGIYEWTIVATNPAGDVVWEVSGTSTRRQTQPPPALPVRATAPGEHDEALDRFLGTWRSEHRLAKAAWTPEEKTGASDLVYRRVLGGKFVQEQAQGADGEVGLTMYTYDTEQECYRLWWFTAAGNAGECTGKWDPVTKTFSWTSVPSPAPGLKVRHCFVNDNAFEWEVTAKDDQGELLLLNQGKATRVSEDGNG